MTEVWKAAPGYESLYEVSNQGRVRSVDRTVTESTGKTRIARGRVLKARPDGNGYPQVQLWSGNKAKLMRAHALVAAAFIGPRPDGQVIRHLDGDPSNNALSNLAYGPQSENERDCYRYGGRHGNGKLFAHEVIQIRKRLSEGDTCTALAKEFGVSIATISCINTNAHFTYI